MSMCTFCQVFAFKNWLFLQFADTKIPVSFNKKNDTGIKHLLQIDNFNLIGSELLQIFLCYWDNMDFIIC